MSILNEKENKTKVEVKQVSGRIGAVVTGIKLTGSLDEETTKIVENALLKHKVLFFRNQTHLTDSEQEAFARLLGEPISHPTVPVKEGTKHILELDSDKGGRADAWHTDVTFTIDYPKITILRSVKVPEFGGDTVWANTVEAYEHLPESLKTLAQQLWAVHSNDFDYAARRPTAKKEAVERYKNVFASKVIETEHPVVRTHPETGEQTLLLGSFVKRISGLSSSASAHLIALFQEYITKLENTVRWQWQEGDVVIWDNRATQHYAINDYEGAHRVMSRVTLKGSIPYNIVGEESKPYS